MTSLADLQQRLQQDILHRGTASLASIRAPEGINKAGRLGVYQNAYKLRLVEILSGEYDGLWAYMGDKAFWRMADRYIDACPSSHPNARYVSNRLAEFLATDPRYREMPALADLARLEFAIEWAFDSPDADRATMETLAALPPERIGDMVLTFAPQVQLITTATNTIDLLPALRAKQTPPALEIAEAPRKVLVWRQEFVSKYREPAAEEAMLIEQALAGKPFATLCEMAAVMDDADTAAGRVAGYLTHWINSEMISKLGIAGQAE
ncbi:MAG: putative DNA-binding domain-containing protein [Nitratireductor sp.]|nr:putative DNA-binding domain-containing protein [Nitratireductor sp.]